MQRERGRKSHYFIHPAHSTDRANNARHHSYKAAESCSARLTEMSHSLTSMIDEINAASSRLNSNSQQQAKQDDPLAQIVRVLNGHLTQLQEIDQGAAALQKKVEKAQGEARVLEGQRGIGGAGWVEGFGRSYGGGRR